MSHYAGAYIGIDFRKHPERYRIGKGEQGVLLAEPYKGELLPHWRFRTPRLARRSADRIYRMFLEYRAQGDFVGMDMARKFLQMGYTRSRRYANHRSGRKYADDGRTVLPREEDPEKAESARIFQQRWKQAREDRTYLELKRRHRDRYESEPEDPGDEPESSTPRAHHHPGSTLRRDRSASPGDPCPRG